MKNNYTTLNTRLEIKTTSNFRKQLKKIAKQNKNIEELLAVVTKLANLEELEPKYKNHNLVDNKLYKNCKECHINPDWLLIYKYVDNELILLLFATGSHAELFNK